MTSARQTVSASATNNVSFATNNLARVEIGHVGTCLNDLTDELVSDDHRHRNRLLRPRVPVVDVDVSAADARSINLDQNIVDANLRLWDIFQPKPRFCLAFNECLHVASPLLLLFRHSSNGIRTSHSTTSNFWFMSHGWRGEPTDRCLRVRGIATAPVGFMVARKCSLDVVA